MIRKLFVKNFSLQDLFFARGCFAKHEFLWLRFLDFYLDRCLEHGENKPRDSVRTIDLIDLYFYGQKTVAAPV